MMNYIFYIYFLILVKNFDIPLNIIHNIPYVNIIFDDEILLNFVLDTSVRKTIIGNENLSEYEEIINSSNYCNYTNSLFLMILNLIIFQRKYFLIILY